MNPFLAQGHHLPFHITAKHFFIPKDTISLQAVQNKLDRAYNYRFHKADSLKILADEAYAISDRNDYHKEKAEALIFSGLYHSDNGDQHLAISYFKKAKDLATEHNLNEIYTAALNDLASEYYTQEKYAKALDAYLQALKTAQGEKDLKMLSVINENMASLYLLQEDFEQAMHHFNKVIALNEEIGDPIFIAETRSNIAGAYAKMGDLELGMFNINAAIRTFQKERIISWLAYAYGVKADIYLKQDNLKWALYWFKQSEELHAELDDERGSIDIYNGLSQVYLLKENDAVAEAYAQKAHKISKKLSVLEGEAQSAKLLYTLSKKLGDHQTALYHHETYQRITDTLQNKRNEEDLMLLKTKLRYEQQKADLIQENEKELAQTRLYVYAAIGFLLALMALALINKRNARIQSDLNKQLLAKTKDLEKSQAYLKEVNATKNKMFRIIGHDLRGPIGAIQGMFDLSSNGEMTNEEFMGFVPKIREDVNSLAFTLNNLLSWSTTQMNGKVTKAVDFDVYRTVEENISLLSEIAANKSISIRNNLVENTLIHSDYNQIDVVIRNLLSNALKFTPNHGQVHIGMTQTDKTMVLYVKDNGVGIEKKVLASLFSSNIASTYGTNNEKGTGLGLNLCKEMVEQNNGTIWAESRPGNGSTFFVSLPKAKKELRRSA
ncbi:ATP-binding protein [Maribacter sp. 2307ULW6-5]|uniref:ATP-binding protein n=1 Tax=Maribacter sp. 2307ULW6-5 TaxID=3386275 RepID=UPI0039BD0761